VLHSSKKWQIRLLTAEIRAHFWWLFADGSGSALIHSLEASRRRRDFHLKCEMG